MHGNQVVYYEFSYLFRAGRWVRTVLDSSLKEGHALACADLLGNGSDQIVAGWRGKNAEGKAGIALYALVTSDTAETRKWRKTVIDDNMACEDLCLADLNGDGKLDIVASGRATHNLKVYFNRERGNLNRVGETLMTALICFDSSSLNDWTPRTGMVCFCFATGSARRYCRKRPA